MQEATSRAPIIPDCIFPVPIQPVQPMPGQVSTYDPIVGREAVARLIVGVELPISFGKNLFYEEFMKNFIPNYQAFSKGAI